MKDYKPEVIEKKWQDYWDEHQTYKALNDDDREKNISFS